LSLERLQQVWLSQFVIDMMLGGVTGPYSIKAK
jgi:hypothetical protein